MMCRLCGLLDMAVAADVGRKQAVFNRIAEIAEEKDLLVINEV